MTELDDVRAGDKLTVTTAVGERRRKIADSAVEGAWGVSATGNRHDFAGVYVREPDGKPGDSVFWPLEDVNAGWN